jgi:subtilisin family serine protease
LVPLVISVLALVILAGPAGASCDPGFERQWGLTQVGAPSAWSKSTGPGVKIGVVDTGIDLQHEDLANKVVAGGRCLGTNGDPKACTSEKADAQDDHGHGTHVAGVAAAYRDNGIGVAGMAPEAQLVVAKVLDPDPDGPGASGSLADINAGIRWVVDKGARVVNLSLGGDLTLFSGVFGNNSFDQALQYAWSKDAVVVLASGNEAFLGLSQNYTGNAIVVGATTKAGERAEYSTPVGGAKWAVMAPGGDGDCADTVNHPCIFSTFWQPTSSGNVYGYLKGTSMATPFVSGAAAALLAQGLNKDQVVARILDTAAPMNCDKPTCGAGRLDAAKALDATAAAPSQCPGSTPTTKKPAGTTATTKATRKPATTRTTAPRTVTTGPDLSETELDVPDEETTEDTLADDNELEIAQAPDEGSTPPKDDGVNGPLAVLATLGVLGVGGTAAPIAVRFFRLRSGGGP